MKTRNALIRAMAIACAGALASFALAGSAFAATVGGADYHGAGGTLESGEVEVLNVDGSAGETVFLTVKLGGRAIAKNLPYTIGENAAAGDTAEWAGVATLDITGLNLDALDGAYTIEAYSDRAGSEQLYKGGLYGVYAELPDGTEKLIGTRVVNDAELSARAYEPAETLYAGGKTYRLAGNAVREGGILRFPYEEYDEATTVNGVVKYTDATGEAVATTTIPGLEYGEERVVDIPSIVTADNGDIYRTVYFANSVTAVNPGSTSFNIYCTKMSEASQALAGFYVATIQMVDETGRVIATDSVDVTGEFTYTAPSVIYKTESSHGASGQSEVVAYEIDGSPTIHLSAANDGVLNRTRTITVGYTAQASDADAVTVNYNLIDGSKRVTDDGRLLGVQKIVADDETPTVTPKEQIEMNGVTYTLVGDPSEYAFTLHTGSVASIDAYYVPEGYKASEAYDVTVNYVNFLTNSVIESHTYVSDPNENARIAIETPATFSADGVEYVRLDGQDADIQHSYYAGMATYTVYYRDVNDTLTSGTVINSIRVVYDYGAEAGGAAEGGVAEGDAAAGIVGVAAGAATGGANAAGAVADAATAFALNAGRTYNVFDGDEANGTLVNEGGVDSNTERIEDNETPLASGFGNATSSAASSFVQMQQWLLPAGAVAAVIVALAAFVMMRRRKSNDDEFEL